MPELPEVETITRGVRAHLLPHLPHKKAKNGLRPYSFSHLEIYWKNSYFIWKEKMSVDARVHATNHRLFGKKVRDVTRRGKWILIRLEREHVIGIHLRMTGRISFSTSVPDVGPHDRVIIAFRPQLFLIFQDIRKFGKVILGSITSGPWTEVGIEPLEADFGKRFISVLQGRRGRIKSLLLNQKLIAGIGNIYADEALFRARIRPTRRAETLSSTELSALATAIPEVLRAALKLGGTTLRDYRNVGGGKGRNQHTLRVYDRTGKKCFRCSGVVKRILVGQRGTHFCPSCQK